MSITVYFNYLYQLKQKLTALIQSM